jgi:RNA polymerase primary sigma factor
MKTETRQGGGHTSGLQIHLREINDASLLSAQEEHELAERIAGGDLFARDRLIRANLRLVVNLARRYLGRGLPLEDLIAEGNLGLMRAVEGFDGGRDIRFTTYASYWIKQSIRRAVINQGALLRLPAYMITLLAKWQRATAVLTDRLGRAPTPTEVGEALRLSKKKVDMVVQTIRVKAQMRTVNASNADEDGLDHILDEWGKDVADRLVEADDLDRIFQGLERLEERNATVIRMRFGLGPYAPMTLHEVGMQLGLSRERIRQLENQALQQLMKIPDPGDRANPARPATSPR